VCITIKCLYGVFTCLAYTNALAWCEVLVNDKFSNLFTYFTGDNKLCLEMKLHDLVIQNRSVSIHIMNCCKSV